MGKYDDIIDLPRPASKYPKMPCSDRAAQFSPFAALTGHDDSIKETARLTEEQIELDESQKDEIGRLLNLISENIQQHPEVSVLWFMPDEHKSGGTYQRIHERVAKIDAYRQELTFGNGITIPLTQIVELSII